MRTLKLFIVIVIVCVSLGLVISCSSSPSQKVADAKANEAAPKQEVNDAVADAQTASQQAAAREEWLKFKGEQEARIAVNAQIIADYKARMTTADGKLRAEYDKSIDALEIKNKELKAKLNTYQEGGKSAWEQFKSEFSHDINELGTAFKDFTVDNKK